jgi:internalin A
MPDPAISPEEQSAYNEALRKIEACHVSGGKVLNLKSMGLTRLPPDIGKLAALTSLDLSDNRLTNLPPEISKLRRLKTLSLASNRLANPFPAIESLSALTTLILSGNPLSTLSPEIGNLASLKELYLNSNLLESLIPEIGDLTALTRLELDGNKLTSLPPEIGALTSLTWLDLTNNRLATLPPELGKLTSLKTLFLHKNPRLSLPPSVLGAGWADCTGWGGDKEAAPPLEILDYYFTSRGKGGRALREVKVILVGRGEVGKSTMVDALSGKRFAKGKSRTDGIAITTLPVKLPDGKAELTLWDFGGQEIMHGTHQFFMTHRSLYVIMVDGRHDRGRQDANYWLKLARAFGGLSSVMVVMNRQKAHPFDIDREQVAQKYDVQLEHFFRTECSLPSTIKPLRKAILAEATRMLAAEEKFPATCWEVKTRLAAMKEHGEDYLSDDCYQSLCKEHGVKDPTAQQKLLRRLADLGTIVSFPDDVKLSELSVLNPEWATDGIYRVVTNEELREVKHGLLTRRRLRELLPKDRWPKSLHVNYVMDLMVKFDLCFPVDGVDDKMLVPELLMDKTPPLGDWEPEKCVVFQYKYPILPHGVLPRFITRTHDLSQEQLRWRTGVVLLDDGAEARLQADYDANTLTIWVRGKYTDARRGILKIIRSNFQTIHARIEGLEPEEMVAIPGHPEVMVSYRDALMDERRGKESFAVTVHGLRMDWPLTELLNGVQSRAEREAAARIARSARESKNIIVQGNFFEGDQNMNDDNKIIIGGNVTGSQIGQTLTNCTNMINQQAAGERKDLLTTVDQQVRDLIKMLPPDKKEEIPEIEENLEMLIKQATAAKPNRRWYDVSAEGLIEASKYVKNFSGNIAGTIKNLGKSLWPGIE